MTCEMVLIPTLFFLPKQREDSVPRASDRFHAGGLMDTTRLCVMPGEVAKAHRHTAAAIRFVIQGVEGAYTVVEGEPVPMRTGDLITTPNWTWHDHYNEGDQPVMWIDGLDVRMVGIGKMLGEPFTQDQQPRTSPVGFSGKTLGHVKPTFIKSEHPTPPFRYAWEDTVETLEALK